MTAVETRLAASVLLAGGLAHYLDTDTSRETAVPPQRVAPIIRPVPMIDANWSESPERVSSSRGGARGQ